MQLQLKDKKVLVLGLGITGLSALRWLKSHGALLSVADTREAPPGLEILNAEIPQVKVHLGQFRREAFIDAEIIVISPGIPLAESQVQDAIKRDVPVVGDVELFAQYRSAQAKLIAITGSNGKSTVTTMVGEMCKAAGLKTMVAGNIGLPVLETLAEEAPDVYVLELSSFQLETTQSLDADAATVLNITEDHLDRYAGLTEYAAAKARIFEGSGVQVLNRQDVLGVGTALAGHKAITFGTDLPPTQNDFGLKPEHDDIWLMQGGTQLIKTSELRIAGLHNAVNALAALALCRALGLDYAPLLSALRDFKGLPHRVQWVAEISGVSFYDDSKGTNVGATCAALAGLPQKTVLIAGGDGKGQDFTPLSTVVKQNARAVVLIGRDGPQIGAVLEGVDIPLLKAPSLQDAVQIAFDAAQSGDAVLLSPACASFDMFRNYVHRAEVFVSAVNALKTGSGGGSIMFTNSMSTPMLSNRDKIVSASYDQALLWVTLILLGIGLVMVYSASIALAEADKATGHQSTYYLTRHASYLLISLAAAFISFQIPMDSWQKMAPWLFITGMILLALVLVPGIGREVNGSRRWISLLVATIQPSEFMKLFATIYVADYTVRKAALLDSFTRGFLPMLAVMLVVGGFLLHEPDFGAFAVIAAIAISILWLGGINGRIFAGLLALLVVGFILLIKTSPYRLQRIVGFMDPWADPFGKGYQLSHALIAFGRGEWFGVGLGASVEKLLYLPEAHTDFLLAVIAEELGFVGVFTVIGLFAWIVLRAFGIGKEAIANERYFSALLAQGIGIWMGAQSIINIGVNMGVLPTKGLTLPLLSFGGSGILANCIALAVLLRIDWENRRLQKGLPA